MFMGPFYSVVHALHVLSENEIIYFLESNYFNCESFFSINFFSESVLQSSKAF
jgi:hypothetical protein